MTREEAIRILDPKTMVKTLAEIEYYGGFTRWTKASQAAYDAYILALSALQEQEERERGCEYCTDSKNIYHLKSGIHDSMDEDVYISGNALVVDIGCHSYGSSVIKFCPMCGRRLYSPKPTPQKSNN